MKSEIVCNIKFHIHVKLVAEGIWNIVRKYKESLLIRNYYSQITYNNNNTSASKLIIRLILYYVISNVNAEDLRTTVKTDKLECVNNVAKRICIRIKVQEHFQPK